MQNENTTSAEPVPVVVADVFERGSGVPAALERLGARVSIEPLTAGDYRIGGGIVVERKTVPDLHGSLGRGRLWAQVGKIRDEAVTPVLLIEGDDLDAGAAASECRPRSAPGDLRARYRAPMEP